MLTMRSPPWMPPRAAGCPGLTVPAIAGGGARRRPSLPKYWSIGWPAGRRSSGSTSSRVWPSAWRTVSGSGVSASSALPTASIESLQVETWRPLTLRMRSPGWMPASAAMLSGVAVTIGA